MAAKSNEVKSSSVTRSTGTSAGTAGNLTPPTTVPTVPVSEPSPTGFEESLQEMLEGFQTYVPTGFVLPTASGGYSQATVVSQLQAVLALYPPVEAAKAQMKQALATQRAAVPGARALMKGLKTALLGYFGHGSPALAKFGIVEKVAAVKTPAEKALSAFKAQQTRRAKGIVGKKQKANAALATQLAAAGAGLAPKGSVPGSVAVSAPPAVPAAAPLAPAANGSSQQS